MTEQTKLNERLRQAHKMEAIGTLAAGIAHDFNNILASISGNLLIAQQDIPVGHPARESHAQIEKAVARAANVVRQILSFSSPSAVKTESIDLEATLNDAVSLLRTAIPSTVEFDTELALNLPSVYADATDIHQILLNLCINAHQAMPGGRGKIAISAEKVYLNEAQAESLVTVTPGWYARIGVKDDGAGMDPTTLKRIFDPFFTTKGPGEGTGLGLAVIYGIVERHRGAITVYSEVGKGSVFSIYLPTAEAISATDDEPKPKPMLQGNGERILYVDDDESLVYMMTRLLPRLNYEVVGFDDPRKGLEAFRADPSSFDLVITDMSMPYLDGPALVHELKAIRQDIPLVMVTGYIRDGDLEKTQSMGVNALMLKPNTVQEMSEDLHRILSGLKEPVTLNGGALNP
jgi:nitrogen-specific signal transduction histidine kinase/CheY-like chemotaxis protein